MEESLSLLSHCYGASFVDWLEYPKGYGLDGDDGLSPPRILTRVIRRFFGQVRSALTELF